MEGMNVRWRVKWGLLRLLMELSTLPLVGRACLRLAGWPLGPYKDKRPLANLTRKSYVSPNAQIKCPALSLAPNCFIDDGVTIYAHSTGGSVTLGQGVHLYRGCILEVGAGGNIIIGEHTHVQAGCHLKGFLRDLRIGANVQLAPHCGLSPYEHTISDPTRPIMAQGIESKGDIVIEDDVWLGLGANVLDGVTIGKGAVIGAGAVVTRSIPANAIAVGVPARVIGRRGEHAGTQPADHSDREVE
jgi:acetyltransferase-like isoleucine patch superfamily enzyme